LVNIHLTCLQSTSGAPVQNFLQQIDIGDETARSDRAASSIRLANAVRQDEKRLRQLGNQRGNESPGLPAVQALWVREHNRHAKLLKESNPSWDDNRLFHRARQFVIAELQWIVKSEYLSALGIDLGEYAGYDQSVDPRTDNAFATAAFRFGHSMLSPLILELQAGERNTCTPSSSIRLCQHFFTPDRSLLGSDISNGLEDVLRGLGTAPAQKIDLLLVEDVRTFMFAPPFPYKQPRMDLAAINIQRGRDHGLLDYNSYRQVYGLDKHTSFDTITSNPEIAKTLERVYDGKIDGAAMMLMIMEYA
jgi:peroxidase